jgi:hypothetical protein
MPFASYLHCRFFLHAKFASIEFKTTQINGRPINPVNRPIQRLIATTKTTEQLPVSDFLNIVCDETTIQRNGRSSIDTGGTSATRASLCLPNQVQFQIQVWSRPASNYYPHILHMIVI